MLSKYVVPGNKVEIQAVETHLVVAMNHKRWKGQNTLMTWKKRRFISRRYMISYLKTGWKSSCR